MRHSLTPSHLRKTLNALKDSLSAHPESEKLVIFLSHLRLQHLKLLTSFSSISKKPSSPVFFRELKVRCLRQCPILYQSTLSSLHSMQPALAPAPHPSMQSSAQVSSLSSTRLSSDHLPAPSTSMRWRVGHGVRVGCLSTFHRYDDASPVPERLPAPSGIVLCVL